MPTSDPDYNADDDALDSGTWVIVNDQNLYFGCFTYGVDEFEKICTHSIFWVNYWQYAKVFHSKESALRALEECKIRHPCWRSAVVG